MERISRSAQVDLLVIVVIFYARVGLVILIFFLLLGARQFKVEKTNKKITIISQPRHQFAQHTYRISAVGTSSAADGCAASGDIGAGGDLVEEPPRGLFGDFGLAIAIARLQMMDDAGAKGRNR